MSTGPGRPPLSTARRRWRQWRAVAQAYAAGRAAGIAEERAIRDALDAALNALRGEDGQA